jgi:CRISPR-associated protein Cst2
MRRRDEGYSETMPGLYNKEEHVSYYKVSFTIDAAILGKDIWILGTEPKSENDKLEINISDSDKKELPGRSDNISSWKVVASGVEQGTVTWAALKDGHTFKLTFEVSDEEKKTRIRHLLETIKNGLYAQSSGEANTIVPLFVIAGAVKVPSPIFHPYLDVRKEDGQWKVIGVGNALENPWLEKDGDQPIVYIQDCERLRVDDRWKSKALRDWAEFLQKLGVEEQPKDQGTEGAGSQTV